MMQHIHYGDWTIEWEQREDGSRDFWICAEQREPRMMRIEAHSYWVKTSLDLEGSLRDCHQLIKDITDRQRRVTMDEILSFHDKHRPPAPATESPVASKEEEERIPF